MMRAAKFVPLILAFAAAAGCGDDAGGRVAVSGKVTLENQPLDDASISFEPLDKQDTRAGSGVSKGAYDIPKMSGLKPGKYLVRITAGDGKTPADAEADAAGPGGSTNIVSFDRVPENWNSRSEQQVEVVAGKSNTFDFSIPKAAVPRKKGK